jgi:UDP-N-acetylmuramyl pentapeptide phosphotransferase/UDP-N-acetylglucosamine-1-phosphate transferase
MIIPGWAYLALFAFTLLIMLVRTAKSSRAVDAQRNIFGADKQSHKANVVSNLGYAFVLFMLAIYFLMMYFKSDFAVPSFLVMLFSLLVVLIVDATIKKRA